MWKFILIIVFFSFLINCTNNRADKKIEFIQSAVYPKLFLLRNIPTTDSLMKTEIKLFLFKDQNIKDFGQKKGRNYYVVDFYKYTDGTSYFLNNKEDSGGFSSEELMDFQEDEIANFIITKCKSDTTKLVGRFHYYGLKGSSNGIREIDTLIYHCN